jgi:protein-S-isoprenylcysteine O-methyltransferase Ste14
VTATGIYQLAMLAVFLGLTVGRAIHVLRHAHANPVPVFTEPNPRRGLVEAALFVLVNLFALEVVLYSLSARVNVLPAGLHAAVLGSAWARAAGVALIAAGMCLNAWAHNSLGDAWRLGVEASAPPRLVTVGAYAFSRHPMYLFFMLYFTGTFLLNGTLVFLLFALVGGVNLHLQAVEEERVLELAFGDEYAAYRRQVRRWLGRR